MKPRAAHDGWLAHRGPLRRVRDAPTLATGGSVTLRLGSSADHAQIMVLAELDSSPPPASPVLLAEVDGQLRAALSLTTGTVVANPFHPTAHLTDLLRTRRGNLGAAPRTARSRRWRILTFVNIAASLALLITLGGVSWAAATRPTASVGSRKLPADALKLRHRTQRGA